MALGQSRLNSLNEVIRACSQCGCNLLNVKHTVLGKDTTMVLFVSGNWSAIAKMEATLPSLEQRLNLKLTASRTTEQRYSGKSSAYSIEITAIDKPGILSGVTEFLLQADIPIEEVSGTSFLTHLGTRMSSLNIKINIPENIHLATFREDFLSYCDAHNLDAFLEPLRNT